MKLMVQSWDETAGPPAYNAETEETKFRGYSVEHEFYESAKVIIKVADVDGSIMQKYNADSGDIYLGVGKITIEDPDGIDYFFGRIKRVSGNSFDKTVTLECCDWLDQLDEEQITYDMREKLGTTDLRQSMARGNRDATADYLRKATVRTLFSAQADDGGFSDETAAANELTEDDMTLLPVLPVVNDAYYFGFETVVTAMKLYISQNGDWAGTHTWEYWDGDSWEVLGIIDPTNVKWVFESGVGLTSYAWVDPGDWAKSTENGVEAYYIRARVATFTAITTQPLGRDCWAEYYLYDDGDYDDDGGMAFVNDAYNGMSLVFTVGMAGSKTWTFRPYASVFTGQDIPADGIGDIEAVWIDNDTTDGGLANNDWTLEYHFQTNIGNNTPSDFYVHDSISGARLKIVWQIPEAAAGNHSHIEIWENDGDSWIELARLEEGDHRHKETWEINLTNLPNIVDSNGVVKIRFNMDRTGGNITLVTYFVSLELDTLTTGHSSAIVITDTQNPNRLQLPTDLTSTTPATCMWEQVPYCVTQPIFTHFDSAEVGTLISDYDGIVTLTHAATIEHTSGLSTRQYKELTSLKIMQDLAKQDKSVFYITLGGTTITYKQTFGADTQQLTDAKVNSWNSYMDYGAMVNEVHAYGARLGDYEIFQSATDTTSETTFNATRTKVLRDTGMVSDADALAKATALAARDANPSLIVGCTITGNTVTAAHATTIKLGEIVEITSSYLWPTAAKDYVVNRLVYDSERHETDLTLHPKVSIGYQELETSRVLSNKLSDQARRGSPDKFVPDPITHEVS